MIRKILFSYLFASAALADISYNPLQVIQGETVINREAAPALIGKTDTDTFTYLRTDSDGKLVTTALTGFGADFTFGDVVSTTTTAKVVRRTTYTEPTGQAQRSVSSASANDSSAGTGLRTLRIVYYDNTGAGPFTTDVTMNGTTAVNTSVSNIRYIEEMHALTVGSGGVNAGIVTIFNSTGGGGGAIGKINASDNRTFWAHHYVATGKIANITGISAGSTSTTVGCGSLFILRAQILNVTNSADIQVSDFVRLYGQSSTFARSYQSPIKIAGPARLVVWAQPECTSSTTYRAAVDFFEP
jgi:hypothetical protein